MAQYHVTRLDQRFKDWRGQKYRDLMSMVIAHNTDQIAQGFAKRTEDDFKKSVKSKTKGARIHIPSWTETIPTPDIHFRKAAEKGTLLTNTLREELSKKLRETLVDPKFMPKRGKNAGVVNADSIKEFEKTVRGVFENYTKTTNRKIGVPSNVYSIAVTEIRSAVNNTKQKYFEKVIEKNPTVVIKKKWKHSGMSRNPRKGHLVLNNKTVGIHDRFKVKNDKGGFDYMLMPHDENAPAEQVISCNCYVEYTYGGRQ